MLKTSQTVVVLSLWNSSWLLGQNSRWRFSSLIRDQANGPLRNWALVRDCNESVENVLSGSCHYSWTSDTIEWDVHQLVHASVHLKTLDYTGFNGSISNKTAHESRSIRPLQLNIRSQAVARSVNWPDPFPYHTILWPDSCWFENLDLNRSLIYASSTRNFERHY